MSAHGDYVTAREVLLATALDVLRAERMVRVDTDAMTRVKKAEDALAIAARDLANAVDGLLPSQRPKGYAIGRDGETA